MESLGTSPGALPSRGGGVWFSSWYVVSIDTGHIAQSPQSSPRWSTAFKMEPVLSVSSFNGIQRRLWQWTNRCGTPSWAHGCSLLFLPSWNLKMYLSPGSESSHLLCFWCWKVVAEPRKTPGFLASRGEEFSPGPETRLDCSGLLCNKVLLKYKRERESFWHRHHKGAERVPPC